MKNEFYEGTVGNDAPVTIEKMSVAFDQMNRRVRWFKRISLFGPMCPLLDKSQRAACGYRYKAGLTCNPDFVAQLKQFIQGKRQYPPGPIFNELINPLNLPIHVVPDSVWPAEWSREAMYLISEKVLENSAFKWKADRPRRDLGN